MKPEKLNLVTALINLATAIILLLQGLQRD